MKVGDYHSRIQTDKEKVASEQKINFPLQGTYVHSNLLLFGHCNNLTEHNLDKIFQN